MENLHRDNRILKADRETEGRESISGSLKRESGEEGRRARAEIRVAGL